jgi:hypothetical protein
LQFQNVQRSGLEQSMTGRRHFSFAAPDPRWHSAARKVIVHPPEYKDGELMYPFNK